MNSHLKTIVIWLVVIAAVVIGFQIFNTAGANKRTLTQSDFYEKVAAGEVMEVSVSGDAVGYEITGKLRTGREPRGKGAAPAGFKTYILKDEKLMETLRAQGVDVKAEKPRDNGFFSLLIMWAPLLLFLGVWRAARSPRACCW